MFDFLRKNIINRELNEIYTNSLYKFGNTPRGVLWNSYYNQTKRFEEILDKILNFSQKDKVKVADIGCGYGAMYEFIKTKVKYNRINYLGIDMNINLIEECKKKYKDSAKFNVGYSSTNSVDFSVMSGTYNYTTTDDINFWEEYIYKNLSRCLLTSKIGLIFNLQHSIPSRIVNNIFYVEPNRIKSKFNLNDFTFKYTKSKYFHNDLIFVILRKS